MLLQDVVGWLRHGAVVVALHLVKRHVLVGHQLQLPPEIGLLLIASEEFQLVSESTAKASPVGLRIVLFILSEIVTAKIRIMFQSRIWGRLKVC